MTVACCGNCTLWLKHDSSVARKLQRMGGELGEQVSPKAEVPLPSEHRSLVASLKEKQLEELRAQVARCGTKCGRRNETPRRNFEDELTWTVQQMEMHRRQIEAHQRQLSILERRHAELVTALSNGGSIGKLFCMDDVLGSEVASTSSPAKKSTSSSKSHSTLLGFTNAMAAAEARLGQKDRHRDREVPPLAALSAVQQDPSSQGWKTVFKAHWPSRAPWLP